jgi:Domain of unknown function (DUF5134)
MSMNPPWLYYLCGVLMLVVAAYSVGLLVISVRTGRKAGRDVELSHAFMGVPMAGMFVGDWAFGPSALWELIFLTFLTWFAVRAVQSVRAYGPHIPHTAVHALMALAMLLMYWFPVGSGASSMSMSAASTAAGRVDPGVAFVVAFLLFGSAISTLASPTKGRSVYGSHAGLATVGPAAGGSLAQTKDGSAVHRANQSLSTDSLVQVISRPVFVDLTHVAMSVAMGFMLILML